MPPALIGQYLAQSTTASIFGAAGSLIVILLWIYYSSQILFFGAEFTQVYANRYGKRLEPAEGAVALTPRERVEQGIPKTKTGWTPQPDATTGRLASLAILAVVIFDLFRGNRRR